MFVDLDLEYFRYMFLSVEVAPPDVSASVDLDVLSDSEQQADSRAQRVLDRVSNLSLEHIEDDRRRVQQQRQQRQRQRRPHVTSSVPVGSSHCLELTADETSALRTCDEALAAREPSHLLRVDEPLSRTFVQGATLLPGAPRMPDDNQQRSERASSQDAMTRPVQAEGSASRSRVWNAVFENASVRKHLLCGSRSSLADSSHHTRATTEANSSQPAASSVAHVSSSSRKAVMSRIAHVAMNASAVVPQVRSGPALIESPDSCFVCYYSTDGSLCDAPPFSSMAALKTHVRHSHGFRLLVAVVTRNNTCCICHSTFTSTTVACNHLQRSLWYGRCAMNRSVYSLPQERIEDLECMICGHECCDTDEFYRHSLEHLPLQPVVQLPSSHHGQASHSEVRQELERAQSSQRQGNMQNRESSRSSRSVPAPCRSRRRKHAGRSSSQPATGRGSSSHRGQRRQSGKAEQMVLRSRRETGAEGVIPNDGSSRQGFSSDRDSSTRASAPQRAVRRAGSQGVAIAERDGSRQGGILQGGKGAQAAADSSDGGRRRREQGNNSDGGALVRRRHVHGNVGLSGHDHGGPGPRGRAQASGHARSGSRPTVVERSNAPGPGDDMQDRSGLRGAQKDSHLRVGGARGKFSGSSQVVVVPHGVFGPGGPAPSNPAGASHSGHPQRRDGASVGASPATEPDNTTQREQGRVVTDACDRILWQHSSEPPYSIVESRFLAKH